jgi:Kef-type K+ transport system membrane component KefB/mannitol/fructose-specific phosphotransferase system IIA component (Ntr-type)
MYFLVDFSLPFRDPVLIVALVLLIILLSPLLLRRFRIPGLIGLILAGVVVGPNALNLLDRDPTIILLGTMGLLYLMFLAGLEINLNLFAKNRNQSIIFGALTFALPQGIGAAMAFYLLGGVFGLDFGWPSAILLGSLFASHTLLAYPIASKLGLAKTTYSTTAVGATIITDVAALLVLAIVAASTRGALDAVFWVRLVVSLAIFVVIMFWLVPRIGKWFFRRVRGEGDAEFVFVLTAVFMAALLAELAGVEAIIGAFLAGLALNRLVPEHGPLMSRIQFVGESLFIPFFLISVGMLVDLRVLFSGLDAWIVAGAMTGTVILTKGAASLLTGPLFGYSPDETKVVFGLTIPQAAATLAAGLIGFEVGLFDTAILNGTIVMILITCLVGPYVTEKWGRKIALRIEVEPPEAGEAPQRILVPLANPQTAEPLMDLAFFVRDPRLEEPIFPLTVARDGENVDVEVAAGERLLSHAVIHAAAADVPVLPMTRVDESIPEGIVRAVKERRISTVIIGWNGQPSAQQRIFGGILDIVLEQTDELILVCRIDHPLNTTDRVVMAVPPFAEREVGFLEAARAARLLASQMGARLNVLTDPAHRESVQQLTRRLRPEVDVRYPELPAWAGLMDYMDKHLRENDLLLLVGAREGTIAWRPALNRLPRILSQRFPNANFITMYPSEVLLKAPPEPDRPGDAVGPETYAPSHILVGLPDRPLEETVAALLAGAFPDDAATRTAIAARLGATQETYSPEVRPGVVLLHAAVDAVEEPVLLVGTSDEGIHGERLASPAHAVVVLLSPSADEHTRHLRALAQVARAVRSDETVEALRRATDPEEVEQVFAEFFHPQTERRPAEAARRVAAAERQPPPAVEAAEAEIAEEQIAATPTSVVEGPPTEPGPAITGHGRL